MFESTDATLSTVWGESVINMVTGTRQGSVESPQMFAVVVDWILQDVADKYGWRLDQGPLQGLRLHEVAFSFDLIAWEGSEPHTQNVATCFGNEVMGTTGQCAQVSDIRKSLQPRPG